MKNQLRMTANRIQVSTYWTIYTEESMENGDSERSDLDDSLTTGSLEEAAEFIAWAMYSFGIDARDSGCFESMYGEMSDYGRNGEREEFSLHIHYGANLKDAAVKDKLESLVWSILVNSHRVDPSRAYHMIGYREPVQKMAANQSYHGTESGFCGATYPAMGFKLYLVK